MLRALPITVFRPARGWDCTNNGVSSRFSELLCLCDEGFLPIDEENPPENLVKIVKRNLFGSEIYHIEPVNAPQGFGWMAGGNYAATSDSRFSRMIGGLYGALSVHDRQETREQYELLSM